MSELKSPAWRRSAPTQAPAPGNATSGEALSLKEAAALEGVPSVQALRQRIQRGTLQTVRVTRGGSVIVGVEFEELERIFGVTLGPSEAEHGPGKDEQAEEQAEQGPEGSGEPESDREEARSGNEHRKPESDPSSYEGASTALQTVEMAVQGWREAKDALELARIDHREELTRLASAHERELKAATGGGRLARLVSGLLATLLVVGAGLAFKLQADAGRKLAVEAEKTGMLRGELEGMGNELLLRSRQLEGERSALQAETIRAEAAVGEASRLEAELRELQAEREAAQEAAKAALTRLGWR
jgi:hypothetical protein